MEKYKEIIKFSVTGIFVVATDIGIYCLFINFLPFAIAKGISFTCGGAAAYLLNKYWTFKQEKKSSSEIVRFIVANSLALVANVLTNEIILRLNKHAIFLALVVATAVTAVFTFIVLKFWVFKR
ncbi:MAG: GtrA family protein [Candidatus Aceula meridiana]|nr:GtrA family protein [Candidatus Aceula meridiana]